MKWLNSLIIAGTLQVLAVTVGHAGANLDQIKQAGVLKVGTEGTYAPFTYHDASGALVGFDVEIAKAIARKARRQGRVPRRQVGWTDRRPRRQPLRRRHQRGRHYRRAQGQVRFLRSLHRLQGGADRAWRQYRHQEFRRPQGQEGGAVADLELRASSPRRTAPNSLEPTASTSRSSCCSPAAPTPPSTTACPSSTSRSTSPTPM